MKSFAVGICVLALFNPAAQSAFLQKGDSGSETKVGGAFVKNIEVAEADQILKEKDTLVLDIRTPGEFKDGHLSSAKNINFYASDFESKLQKLDKTKVYLLHCASGGRSAKAREIMKKMGFKKIYHLQGGIQAWIKAGKPVDK